MKNKAFLILPVILVLSLLGCKKELVEPEVHNPYIRGLSATPSNVSKGGATTLECFATDPDQNTLSYTWTCQAGKLYTDTTFSTETDTGNPIVWKAPDNSGIFVIDIKVEDGTDGSADSSIAIPVGSYKLLEVLGTGVLTEPMGIFVEGSGDVWVADAGDNNVWNYDGVNWSSFSFAGIKVDTIVDTLTGDTTYKDDTLSFTTPMDVYLDGGMIYVLDSGVDKVHRFSTPGPAGYDTSFSSISGSNNNMYPPTSFVVEGDYIYAACGNVGVRKRDLSTGQVEVTTDPRQARGITFDGAGNLWVTVDQGSPSPPYYWIRSYIKMYDQNLNVDPTKTIEASVYRPWGIAVGPSGNIFVSQLGDTATADCHIAEFTSAGSFVGKWGDTGSGSEQFNSPAGLWVTSDRKIYVCDRGNGVVKIFGPD
ncbi:hypothetical protein E3J62_08850 [candidate division TA06 bacterium]|uniref:Ig-like domain-containing protein n=1 Tax=candidate division TA06 bacterium TaxID=2250710 RepID=A0A523UR06_UNCT6|nr:MAG: hypothetical protein E3J62_08850 [candidate division TA06 bacterium]